MSSKAWRIAVSCTLIAGISVTVPLVVSGIVSATTPIPDKIIYVQKSAQQKTGPFVEYIGANGTTLTQSISTGSGSCFSSTDTNPSSPLLPITASYYGTGQPPYSGTASPASVGSAVFGGVADTGVCVNSKTSPGYTIQPNEGLVFSVGSNLLTAGRLFNEATIPLKRIDNTRGSLTGAFILRRANSSGVEQTVDTIPFSVPQAGTESAGDDNDCPDTSTSVVPAADQFNQLEIQVDSPSTGAISVIGPNCDNDDDADDQAVPTFYLDTAPTLTTTANPTFTVGVNSTFTVSATGYPVPTVTDSFAGCATTLPTGLTFTSGTGSATLSGTPAAGTGGTYTLCINATNAAASATEELTLTVDQAPVITSASSTTFTVGGGSQSFQVAATGYPGVSYSLNSSPITASNGGGTCTPTPLPGDGDVSFSSSGLLSGTPAMADDGTYTLCIVASNGVLPNYVQQFTFTINDAPAITSAANTTFTVGGGSQSFQVAATGYPGVSYTLSSSPITASNGGGTCTPTPVPTADSVSLPSGDSVSLSSAGLLSGNPLAGDGGTYTLCIVASNGVSPEYVQQFTLTIDQAPSITSTGTTFTVNGGPQAFQVLGAGYPAPSYSLSSALVTASNGTQCTPTPLPTDGSVSFSSGGMLTGDPETGDGGSYTLCIVATNNVGAPYVQQFTLTIDEAPSITSYNNDIVPAGDAFSYLVTATGFPPPSFSIDGSPPEGCLSPSELPGDLALTPATPPPGATAAATLSSEEGLAAGSYCFQIDATNVAGEATQLFTLDVTSPSTPLQATVTEPSGDTVSAGLALDTGSKSFTDFTAGQTEDGLGTLGVPTTVQFLTEGTSTYTATLDVNWGDLAYCVPYAGTSTPTCSPAYIVTTSGDTPILPCVSGAFPANPPGGWCSLSADYTYPYVDGVEYTNIVEVLQGSGDLTITHP
ncbi:MAG TPA: Ig domain-containing protein [Acidimicrobiales bacterium]|nr:Ig domain-containing protein [Acidimicrobiales bacterium]